MNVKARPLPYMAPPNCLARGMFWERNKNCWSPRGRPVPRGVLGPVVFSHPNTCCPFFPMLSPPGHDLPPRPAPKPAKQGTNFPGLFSQKKAPIQRTNWARLDNARIPWRLVKRATIPEAPFPTGFRWAKWQRNGGMFPPSRGRDHALRPLASGRAPAPPPPPLNPNAADPLGGPPISLKPAHSFPPAGKYGPGPELSGTLLAGRPSPRHAGPTPPVFFCVDGQWPRGGYSLGLLNCRPALGFPPLFSVMGPPHLMRAPRLDVVFGPFPFLFWDLFCFGRGKMTAQCPAKHGPPPSPRRTPAPGPWECRGINRAFRNPLLCPRPV